MGLDPGTTHSQFVIYGDGRVIDKDFLQNSVLVSMLPQIGTSKHAPDFACIEMVASFGMAVGKEVFETCRWIGRFEQQLVNAGISPRLIYRNEVKLHLCNSVRAKDPNIRQALLDRWGGRELAVGTKKAPGPLYGVSSHAWAALALAVTFADQLRKD